MGNIITLTTDFGTRDYFSGGMKGVILGINPEANIVDITHEVPSQDIWGAAYVLGAAYGYFPAGTVHVVVVDPGVGSDRRPIMAVTDKYVFIGPDNGVLSFVFADPGFSRVYHINASHYFLPMKGSTFHAREIFAPIAAWLTKGITYDRVGDEITDFVRFAAAGFDVVVCSGPTGDRSCAAIEGGTCDAVAGADVVLNEMRDKGTQQAVARAVSAMTPAVPMVVCTPLDEHDLPAGCIPLDANVSVSGQAALLRRAALGHRQG